MAPQATTVSLFFKRIEEIAFLCTSSRDEGEKERYKNAYKMIQSRCGANETTLILITRES